MRAAAARRTRRARACAGASGLACFALLLVAAHLAPSAAHAAHLAPRRALHDAAPAGRETRLRAAAAGGGGARRRLLFDTRSFQQYLLDLFTVTYRFLDAELYAGLSLFFHAITF